MRTPGREETRRYFHELFDPICESVRVLVLETAKHAARLGTKRACASQKNWTARKQSSFLASPVIALNECSVTVDVADLS
jgi:hypothetical protein